VRVKRNNSMNSTNTTNRLPAALAKIDEANSTDPNRVVIDAVEQSKEVVYSKRMSDWLARLDPNASEVLKIAAHGQHICRWTIPRAEFPMDRPGYHRWRSTCQKMHAEKLGEILRGLDYDADTIARVQSLVRKERMKLDPESQLLEDVVCLVFLENYFADFAKDHDEMKLIDIVRKTWKKMSPQGHSAALTLALDDASKRIVGLALAD
jgi:hypothetical protein